MQDFYTGISLQDYNLHKLQRMGKTFALYWYQFKHMSRMCAACMVLSIFFVISLCLCWLAAGMMIQSNHRAFELVHPVLDRSDWYWDRGVI